MKRSSIGILAAFALAWLLFEWFYPPVSITESTTVWGGGRERVTSHARRGMEERSWGDYTRSEINFGVLILECAIVAVAVGAGLSALRQEDAGIKASSGETAVKIMARCALVLHGSVVLVPFCHAGADTLWAIEVPNLIVLIPVFLWPNFLVSRAAFKLSGFSRNYSSRECLRTRVVVFSLIVAIIWSVFLIIAGSANFDVNTPLGGAILGTVALWFTVFAELAAMKLRAAGSPAK